MKGKSHASSSKTGKSATALVAGTILLLLAACAAPAPKDTGAIFYPPLPQLPRVQFLTTINVEEDLGGGRSEFSRFLLGTEEVDARRLVRPWDVAHEKDKLYVIDRTLGIVIIDLKEGTFDTIRDIKGGPLREPSGIAISEDGYKFIADKARGQVLVFNERNEFSHAYGAEGQFQPIDVAVFGNRVYVVDLADNEVEVLDRETGDVLAKIGETGRGNGQFRWPTHITLDAQGRVYVTDFMNFRIQRFDADGNFEMVIGELGDLPGSTPRPKGIAVSKDGHLYVVDAAFELVQVFDTRNAEVLLGFGKYGNAPGGTYLPAGIDIDYDNVGYFSKFVDPNFRAKYLIYVANQAGSKKLNVYAFGEWTGPPPAGVLRKGNTGASGD